MLRSAVNSGSEQPPSMQAGPLARTAGLAIVRCGPETRVWVLSRSEDIRSPRNPGSVEQPPSALEWLLLAAKILILSVRAMKRQAKAGLLSALQGQP